MENNQTLALFHAMEDGDIEEVKNLLAKGADVNAKNEEGKSALFLAIEQQLPEMGLFSAHLKALYDPDG